jgi:hypothetical protein
MEKKNRGVERKIKDMNRGREVKLRGNGRYTRLMMGGIENGWWNIALRRRR